MTPRGLGKHMVGQDIACACGCGEVFQFKAHARNQQYAPSCKTKQARHNRKKLAIAKTRKAGLQGDSRKPLREKQFICKICLNLPHRRPTCGCSTCGLPFQEAT